MATIKKFNQFNTSEWIGPLKVLDIKENKKYKLIYTVYDFKI